MPWIDLELVILMPATVVVYVVFGYQLWTAYKSRD